MKPLTLRRFAKIVALCLAFFGASLAQRASAQGPNLPPGTRFIMSHFGSDGGGGIEKLFISISPDGLNWQCLNDGQPVWAPPGWAPFWNVVRDPSIVFANGWYWVAYTSGNYGNHASFGLVKSQNLVDWTFVGEIPTNIPGATDPLTWGPFFFKDADGTVHLFVSISPVNSPVPAMRTHKLQPLNADFTQWSAPVPVALPSTNTNECWVWKEGNIYHAIYVDFASSGRYFHTTSTDLVNGWTTPQLLGFASLEGGFILKKPTGGYRLYLEPGNIGGFQTYRFYDCSDQFTNFDSEPTHIVAQTPMRNGKVIAAPATTTYSQWSDSVLAQAPPADRLPLSDPDGDNLSNAIEFRLGFSPTVPDASASRLLLKSDNTMRFLYTRALFAAGSPLTPQVAESFPEWESHGPDLQLRSITLMSDGRELLEWSHPATQLFLRLSSSTP